MSSATTALSEFIREAVSARRDAFIDHLRASPGDQHPHSRAAAALWKSVDEPSLRPGPGECSETAYEWQTGGAPLSMKFILEYVVWLAAAEVRAANFDQFAREAHRLAMCSQGCPRVAEAFLVLWLAYCEFARSQPEIGAPAQDGLLAYLLAVQLRHRVQGKPHVVAQHGGDELTALLHRLLGPEGVELLCQHPESARLVSAEG